MAGLSDWWQEDLNEQMNDLAQEEINRYEEEKHPLWSDPDSNPLQDVVNAVAALGAKKEREEKAQFKMDNLVFTGNMIGSGGSNVTYYRSPSTTMTGTVTFMPTPAANWPTREQMGRSITNTSTTSPIMWQGDTAAPQLNALESEITRLKQELTKATTVIEGFVRTWGNAADDSGLGESLKPAREFLDPDHVEPF